MWGSDYPHLEGTPPFSEEAIRLTFAGRPRGRGRGDARRATPPRIYGFDLDRLDAARRPRCGPEVDAVGAGLDRVPDGAQSLAFRPSVVPNV